MAEVIEMTGADLKEVSERVEKNLEKLETKELEIKAKELLTDILLNAEATYLLATVQAEENTRESLVRLAAKVGAIETLSSIWEKHMGEPLPQLEPAVALVS